ncbi:aspartate dehydrogenase [Roseovarius aestuarii]|nr:aspartate dehydrogenase [Roseovarius aestuarii]
MQNVGLIGYGAIACYVATHLRAQGASLTVLARPGREDAARAAVSDALIVTDVAQMLARTNLVVDCAGHAGLGAHGADILRQGTHLITLSLGALADTALYAELESAAQSGNGRLHLASGAIGALDALGAAAVGGLEMVRYTGRKPPLGWAGSPAEKALDLATLTQATPHFTGCARDAALLYPKNANVAAAVALAGIGFDKTEVQLIADPTATGNTHRVEARGAFGSLDFTITGAALPDNPKSSALAAMSAVRAVQNAQNWLRM